MKLEGLSTGCETRLSRDAGTGMRQLSNKEGSTEEYILCVAKRRGPQRQGGTVPWSLLSPREPVRIRMRFKEEELGHEQQRT